LSSQFVYHLDAYEEEYFMQRGCEENDETNQEKRRAKIVELQEKLQEDQMAFLLSETCIQRQKETLTVHEIKIRGVNSEKIQALEEKAKLKETTQESNVEIME